MCKNIITVRDNGCVELNGEYVGVYNLSTDKLHVKGYDTLFYIKYTDSWKDRVAKYTAKLLNK